MSSDRSITNSTASNDAPSDLLLDDKDVTCPVCKEVFVFPRTYECGHTICELCMYEMDRRDCNADTHTASIHHCPVCRHATLRSWHSRPLSVILEKIASGHPDYPKRRVEVLEERSKREGSIIYIPKDIDLAYASHTARLKLSFSIYEVLIELLFKAARRGLSHLIIKDKTIVGDIEKVIDLLSVQLFAKHNVYKILVTRGECTIYIHRDAFSWRRQYENGRWEDPGGSDEDESPPLTGGPAPPRSRRESQFSGVLDALLSHSLGPPAGLPPLGTFSRNQSRR
jgi:hypothetical protein